jgi:hypothetical protein
MARSFWQEIHDNTDNEEIRRIAAQHLEGEAR